MPQQQLEERAMLAGDVQVRFEYVDDSQNVVNALTTGEDYTLRAYVQDITTDPEGIFSAYLDFNYDSSLINFTGPITHGEEISASPLGNTNTPGVIDEVGAVDTDQSPGTRNPNGSSMMNPEVELFWFSIPFSANSTGDLTFSANQAETPTRRVILFNTTSAVQISDIMFVNTSVEVNPVDAPEVSIAPTTDGNETGPSDGLFTVTQSIATGVDTVVGYTVSGTATEGTDFANLSGTVTIPANQTSATIPVSVLTDDLIEADESVIVTLNSMVTSGDPTVSVDAANDTATISLFDDDVGTVTIAAGANGDEEGPVDGSFTVTQSAMSSTDTVIGYTVTGSATSGADFTALSGSVTIPAGSTTATIDVPVIDDALVESLENVIVTLDVITSGDTQIVVGSGSFNNAMIEIADNDVAQVSIAPTRNGEEEGPVSGQLTVTLSEESGTDTVISYTTGGTATSGSDYSAPSGSVTIPAGSLTAVIDIPVIDDNIAEETETLSVTLDTITSGSSSIEIDSGNDSATIDILDNEEPTVRIDPTTDGSESGPTNGQFTVTQSAESSTDTVISYTVTGTATSGSDFTALSGTVTIPAGSTTAVIEVPVLTDSEVEGEETVIVTLDAITAGDADLEIDSTGTDATINIADDTTATVSVAATTDGNEEGPVAAVFTVTQSAMSSVDTVIAYSLTGAAVAGTDYTAPSGTVTIAAGETSATITIDVTDDTTVEDLEDITLTLDSITSGSPDISIDSAADNASLDILDNDAAEASVMVGADATEATDGSFTVTLDQPSSTDTVISYTVTGTATSGEDFQPLAGTVTIPAGDTSTTIDLIAIPDDVVEGTETVIVTFDAVTSGNDQITIAPGAQATLNLDDDNDTATVSIAAGDNADEEGPVNGSFTVTQSAASSTDTVVSYTLTGTATEGDDFTTLTGTVTIPAGDTTATITIEPIDDSDIEGTETVIVTLDTVTMGSDQITVDSANDSATIDLLDNEAAQVRLAAGDDGDETGPVSGTFIVTQDIVTDADTVIAYTITGGTATEGDDFTALSGTVTILAGMTSATITLDTIDDMLVEGAESLELTIDSIQSGSSDLNIDTDNDLATISFADNDSATVSIAGTTDGDEAGPTNGQFTLSLSQASAFDTTVTFTLSGDATSGDDFQPLTSTFIIPAGSTSQTIDIETINDTLVEETESLTITLDSVMNDSGQVTLDTGAASDSIDILDDAETALVSIAATTNGTEEPLGDGLFTVTQSAESSTDTVISYQVTGTATAGDDYTALSGTVTIPAGSTSATIAVPVIDDQDVEGQETVILTLDMITAGDAEISIDSAADTAEVRISDNETPFVRVSGATPGDEEGPFDGIFTISQTITTQTDTVVTYTISGTATEGDDYTTITRTATIPAGDTSVEVAIPVIDDNLVEDLESVILTIDSIDGDAQLEIDDVQASRQLSILDNDQATVSVTATADGNEDGPVNGQFTFTLSQPSATDTTVAYTVSGSATADEDYTAIVNEVTIAAGDTSVTVDVIVADDQMAEGDETVIVTLDSITAGLNTIGLDGAATEATVTIVDDDLATVSIADTADGDEAGPVDGQFTVTQSGMSQQDTVIAYTVTGTATSGEDFTPLSGTVTILAGESTATIDVSVLDDMQVEGTESVIVTLDTITSGSAGVALDSAASEATVSIADDDVADISIEGTTDADEGTLTSGEFTVSISMVSDTDTVIAYTVTGTATPDEDYAALSGTVTIPAGDTSVVVEVPIIDDFNIEGDETVIVTLDSITSGAAGLNISATENEATISVIDDEVDNAVVSIAALVDGEETGDMSMPTDGQFLVSITNSSATDTVISYTVTGTATADADYTALSGTVTIPAGQLTAEINVPTLDDLTVEETETVIVTLDEISMGHESITIDPTFDSDVVNILDDGDTATLSLVADNDGDEAGPVNGQFTVTLSEASGTDTVVNYTVTGTATSGDDFTPLTGMVTIPAGDTSATILVEVIDDNLLEEEELVTLTLDSIETGDPDITIDTAADTDSVAIASDDQGLVSIANTTDGSEDGPVDGQFTVSLSAISETDTVVSYTVTGTATSGADYTALSGTVTILAGETTATIEVPVLDDSLIEGSETVELTLEEITAGDAQITIDSAGNQATVDIADDDDGLISIAPTTDGNEAGPVDGVFTVTQAGETATDTVISYTVTGTATSGDDFTALSGTVTIPAGSTTATITVPVLDDSLIEVDETVVVTLDSITSGDAQLVLDSAGSEATVNITSDDTGEVSIAPGTDGNETGPVDGTFTINLDGTADVDVVVVYTVSGTATSGDDFTALSGTATILAGQSSVTVTVPVIDDDMVEDDETVTLTLDSVTADGVPVSISTTDDEATISIISDNDESLVSIAPTTDGSELGPVNGRFTVTMQQASSTDTIIVYDVSGTATEGNDYANLSGTITIPAGDTTATIDIDVTDDINVEGDETVIVTLQSVTAGADEIVVDTANDEAAIDLIDDEVSTNPEDSNTATVSFEEGSSMVTEADGSTTVNVVLSIPSGGVLERSVTVDITVAGGTASSPGDFSLTTTTVTFAAGSQDGDTQAVNLTIVDDSVMETSETVSLELSVPTSSALDLPVATPDTHTLTITDDSNDGTISGSVYVDGDKDGTRDDNEIGVPGITIELTGTGNGGQTIELTAMTDDDGNYSFIDLPGGTYTITQVRSTSLHDFDNELGTIDGDAAGTIDDNTFTDIELEASGEASGFGFGEAGLMTPFANIRYLLSSSNYTELFRESVARAAELDGDADGAEDIRTAAVPSVVSSGLDTSSSTSSGEAEGEGEGEGEGEAFSGAPAAAAVAPQSSTPTSRQSSSAAPSEGEPAPIDQSVQELVAESQPTMVGPQPLAAKAESSDSMIVINEGSFQQATERAGNDSEQKSLGNSDSSPQADVTNEVAALLASQTTTSSSDAATDSVFSTNESWLDDSEELEIEF